MKKPDIKSVPFILNSALLVFIFAVIFFVILEMNVDSGSNNIFGLAVGGDEATPSGGIAAPDPAPITVERLAPLPRAESSTNTPSPAPSSSAGAPPSATSTAPPLVPAYNPATNPFPESTVNAQMERFENAMTGFDLSHADWQNADNNVQNAMTGLESAQQTYHTANLRILQRYEESGKTLSHADGIINLNDPNLDPTDRELLSDNRDMLTGAQDRLDSARDQRSQLAVSLMDAKNNRDTEYQTLQMITGGEYDPVQLYTRLNAEYQAAVAAGASPEELAQIDYMRNVAQSRANAVSPETVSRIQADNLVTDIGNRIDSLNAQITALEASGDKGSEYQNLVAQRNQLLAEHDKSVGELTKAQREEEKAIKRKQREQQPLDREMYIMKEKTFNLLSGILEEYVISPWIEDYCKSEYEASNTPDRNPIDISGVQPNLGGRSVLTPGLTAPTGVTTPAKADNPIVLPDTGLDVCYGSTDSIANAQVIGVPGDFLITYTITNCASDRLDYSVHITSSGHDASLRQGSLYPGATVSDEVSSTVQNIENVCLNTDDPTIGTNGIFCIPVTITAPPPITTTIPATPSTSTTILTATTLPAS
ncbi:MAG: hypothetical protein V1740_00200 [Candidatus Woesearchaeota archaeon]